MSVEARIQYNDEKIEKNDILMEAQYRMMDIQNSLDWVKNNLDEICRVTRLKEILTKVLLMTFNNIDFRKKSDILSKLLCDKAIAKDIYDVIVFEGDSKKKPEEILKESLEFRKYSRSRIREDKYSLLAIIEAIERTDVFRDLPGDADVVELKKQCKEMRKNENKKKHVSESVTKDDEDSSVSSTNYNHHHDHHNHHHHHYHHFDEKYNKAKDRDNKIEYGHASDERRKNYSRGDKHRGKISIVQDDKDDHKSIQKKNIGEKKHDVKKTKNTKEDHNKRPSDSKSSNIKVENNKRTRKEFLEEKYPTKELDINKDESEDYSFSFSDYSCSLLAQSSSYKDPTKENNISVVKKEEKSEEKNEEKKTQKKDKPKEENRVFEQKNLFDDSYSSFDYSNNDSPDDPVLETDSFSDYSSSEMSLLKAGNSKNYSEKDSIEGGSKSIQHDSPYSSFSYSSSY